MKKLLLTNKETPQELAEALCEHIGGMASEVVAEVISQAYPEGLQEFKKTQLRAQKVGEGAMKAHFLYYAISTLDPNDQACLIDNIADAAGLVKGDKVKLEPDGLPTVYIPGKGVGNC